MQGDFFGYDPTHRETMQVLWQHAVQQEKLMAPHELLKLLRQTGYGSEAGDDVKLYLLAKIALELQRLGDFVEAETRKENHAERKA